MSKSEAQRMYEGRLAVGQLPGVALWRNQASLEEHGWKEAAQKAIAALRRGDAKAALHELTHANIRKAQAGLCKGASDNIGIVAPHGRFLALEWKSERGRLTPEQSMFLNLVNKRGGIGRCVRTTEEATAAVEAARR